MSVVYCDLVNGIDWYALTAWSSATTYALDALVKTSASTTSANAQVYKSLQAGNTNHDVTDGSWWVLVADGSAAKPFKTIDDATRGLTGGDEWRCAKTADGVALSGSYTFNETGTNAGKVTVAGNNPDSLTTSDYIGDMNIGIFKITTITGSSPTVITVSPVFYTLDATASKTLATTYKYQPITLTALQTVQSGGVSESNRLIGSGGWNLSNPASPVRDGYTRIAAYGIKFNGSFVAVSYLHFCGVSISAAGGVIFADISYCTVSAAPLLSSGISYLYIADCLCSSGLGADWTTTSNITCLRDVFVNAGNFLFACKGVLDRCAGRFGLQYFAISQSSGRGFVVKNSSVRITSFGSPTYGDNTILVLEKTNTILSALPTVSTMRRGCHYVFELVADDYRNYYYTGNVFSDSSVRHTASGLAWRYEPNALANARYPLELIDVSERSAWQIGVSSGQVVTATIYIKKSSADAGLEAVWTCKGGQSAGPVSDVVATATDSTDWQQLSVTFTATATGVVELSLQVWGSSTATVHCDDFGASAA